MLIKTNPNQQKECCELKLQTPQLEQKNLRYYVYRRPVVYLKQQKWSTLSHFPQEAD